MPSPTIGCASPAALPMRSTVVVAAQPDAGRERPGGEPRARRAARRAAPRARRRIRGAASASTTSPARTPGAARAQRGEPVAADAAGQRGEAVVGRPPCRRSRRRSASTGSSAVGQRGVAEVRLEGEQVGRAAALARRCAAARRRQRLPRAVGGDRDAALRSGAASSPVSTARSSKRQSPGAGRRSPARAQGCKHGRAGARAPRRAAACRALRGRGPGPRDARAVRRPAGRSATTLRVAAHQRHPAQRGAGLGARPPRRCRARRAAAGCSPRCIRRRPCGAESVCCLDQRHRPAGARQQRSPPSAGRPGADDQRIEVGVLHGVRFFRAHADAWVCWASPLACLATCEPAHVSG